MYLHVHVPTCTLHLVHKYTCTNTHSCTFLIHVVHLLILSFLHRRPNTLAKIKPHAVDQYNQYMLGVDRLDQRMAYYQFTRKSVRWWRKVFFWMVEVVVVNSYIMYTAHTDAHRKFTHKKFRQDLVMSLCEPQREVTPHRQPTQRDYTLERLRGRHFPETSSTRRDCRVCSSRAPGHQRHLTTIICGTCLDHPHLCARECFRIYHTRVNI